MWVWPLAVCLDSTIFSPIFLILFFLHLSLFGSFSKFYFFLMFQKPILAKNRILDSALTSLGKYQVYLE